MRPANVLRRQGGAGLIEVMIALLLGLLLIAGVFQVFLGNKRNYELQNSLIHRQESTRFAVHTLTQDIQMTGYRGCARDAGTARNTLNDVTNFLYDFGRHIEGFDAQGGGWSPALPPSITGVAGGTDVLTVRTVDDPDVYITQPMPTSSADLKTNDNLDPPPLAIGDIVLVSDCGGAAIFQVTNYTVANGNIVHNAGVVGGLSPGNATTDLGRRFPAGSQLFKVRTTTYYIADSANGTGPALWRRIGTQAPQELVEGIESLQILYGEDNDGDFMPDVYRKADAVASWDDIVSLRIAMLVASWQGPLAEDDPRTFTVLDEVLGPFNDGRLRNVLTTTVALRNRML